MKLVRCSKGEMCNESCRAKHGQENHCYHYNYHKWDESCCNDVCLSLSKDGTMAVTCLTDQEVRKEKLERLNENR